MPAFILTKLAVSLLIPLLMGFILLKRLFYKTPLPVLPALALGYGLGLGILSQWMLLLGILKIEYNVATIAVPLVLFTFVVNYFLNRKQKKTVSPIETRTTDKGKIDWIAIVLLIYVAYYVIYVFWWALSVPVFSWDALATIAFKAKVFFYERLLPDLRNLPHSSYPLHVPFVETWIALNLGEWNDRLIQIVFPLTFLAFLVIVHYFLREFTNRRWSLFGVGLLVSANFFIVHAMISYRDFFLMYYNCTTIMLLLLWDRKKERAFLFLAGLFAGFTTFVKLEGTAYLLIQTILFFWILSTSGQKQRKNVFLFLLPAIGVVLVFYLHKWNLGIKGEHFGIHLSFENIQRLPLIAKKFLQDLFFSGNWNLLWWILGVSFFINTGKIKKCREVRLLALSLFLFFGFYFLFALLLPYSDLNLLLGLEAKGALSRVNLHFFPLTIPAVILLNYPENPAATP